jgi:hypothetical protein
LQPFQEKLGRFRSGFSISESSPDSPSELRDMKPSQDSIKDLKKLLQDNNFKLSDALRLPRLVSDHKGK